MANFLRRIANAISSSLVLGSTTNDIHDFVAAYSAVWNQHDEKELVKFFADSADFIMGGSPRFVGRTQIGQWWRTYFSHIDPNRRGDFQIDSSMVLADNVRLLNVLTKTSGEDVNGEPLEIRRARGTWILVRYHDSWQIQAMRGNPAVGESRTKPGIDR